MSQGIQSSDSVLGVSTPGRFSYTGGVYFYNNLSSTEPQTTISRDLKLGLTRQHSVRAHVDIFVDLPHTDPINVADNPDSIYGKWCKRCTCSLCIVRLATLPTEFYGGYTAVDLTLLWDYLRNTICKARVETVTWAAVGVACQQQFIYK